MKYLNPTNALIIIIIIVFLISVAFITHLLRSPDASVEDTPEPSKETTLQWACINEKEELGEPLTHKVWYLIVYPDNSGLVVTNGEAHQTSYSKEALNQVWKFEQGQAEFHLFGRDYGEYYSAGRYKKHPHPNIKFICTHDLGIVERGKSP